MVVQEKLPDDATAQTLNYALGNLGGRQKSWMQAANPSAHLTPADLTVDPLPFTMRKRGRPRKDVPQPRSTESARPTIEPQAETQPPSNSTSPQLANVVTRQANANHVPSVITVFPSPTPSEENMLNALAPVLRGGDGAANLDFLELNPEQTAYAPETPLETVFMDEVRRAASGSKRPSEEAGGASASKRVQQAPPTTLAGATGVFAQQPYRTSTPPVHAGRPQLQHTHSRSVSFGQGRNAQIPSPQLPQGFSSDMMSPQVRRPSGPARTLSGRTEPALYSVPTDYPSNLDAGSFQASQAVNLQPTWYTREECLQALTTFRASFAVAPDHQRDGRRINVLKDATDQQDWQYLVMHQFYCLLDYNPDLLPMNLRALPGLQQGLKLIQDVLDSNKKLSPAVLHFFSNYPYHLGEIRAKWPAGLEEHSRRFWSFVALTPNYEQLKLTCERRRFPPVAWELARYLGLESTTFQRLLFTASLRCIWRGVPQNAQQAHYEAKAVSIFQQSQASYSQRLAEQGARQYFDLNQVPQDDITDLQHWGTLLKQLVGEYEATVHHQGHLANPTSNNLSPYVQQQPVQSHQSPDLARIEAEMSSRARRPADPHSAQAAIQQTRGRGRPRKHHLPVPNVLPSQPPYQNQQQQAHPRVQQHQQPYQPRTQQPQQQHQQQPHQHRSVPLLPSPGWLQPQQRQPNPSRFSLHQAQLRSPVLQARSVDSPLYHFVEGFIKAPARLTNANEAVEKWTFTFDAHMARYIAAAVPRASDGAERRAVDTQSKTIRVRCVKWAAVELPGAHTWATTDTSWIPYSYFTFNDKPLHQRKKVHHGKDLPIDITGLVEEGENTLQMTVMAQSNDASFKNYLVAIELLGVMSQASIRRRCLEQCRIPAEQVLADIQRKLNGSSEDDEIAVVESNLTINLFDPFSASKMCDIPVRSKACLHNDCFDLDTFLETRKRKGDASMPDQWRCPICRADARPQYLVVDGFLEEVKKALDAQGRSNTRAINVHQDGSWKPKAEVRDPNGVSDATSEPATPVVAPATLPSRASISAQVEIIDLSD